MHFKDKNFNVDQIMVDLKILTVGNRVKLSWCKIIHMFFQGLLPKQFNDVFTPYNHKKHTRSCEKKNLFFRQCRLNLYKNSIVFQGVKIWNELSKEIQLISSKSLFKSSLKKLLLQNQIL